MANSILTPPLAKIDPSTTQYKMRPIEAIALTRSIATRRMVTLVRLQRIPRDILKIIWGLVKPQEVDISYSLWRFSYGQRYHLNCRIDGFANGSPLEVSTVHMRSPYRVYIVYDKCTLKVLIKRVNQVFTVLQIQYLVPCPTT